MHNTAQRQTIIKRAMSSKITSRSYRIEQTLQLETRPAQLRLRSLQNMQRVSKQPLPERCRRELVPRTFEEEDGEVEAYTVVAHE